MLFTYEGYASLLSLLRENGYEARNFHDYKDVKRSVVLRHDVDNTLQKALEIAKIEQIGGVKSTFFLMLSSDFYNVFSAESKKIIEMLYFYGHEIGLHFDEMRYADQIGNVEGICERIHEEAGVLAHAVGKPVRTVSMHRPSQRVIDADLKISGIVNTYSKEFFVTFKYLSDSRRRWREPVEKIIKSGQFERLQILVHPFWYNKKELNIHDSVCAFVNHANLQRYETLDDNFTSLNEVMSRTEITGVNERMRIF